MLLPTIRFTSFHFYCSLEYTKLQIKVIKLLVLMLLIICKLTKFFRTRELVICPRTSTWNLHTCETGHTKYCRRTGPLNLQQPTVNIYDSREVNIYDFKAEGGEAGRRWHVGSKEASEREYEKWKPTTLQRGILYSIPIYPRHLRIGQNRWK